MSGEAFRPPKQEYSAPLLLIRKENSSSTVLSVRLSVSQCLFAISARALSASWRSFKIGFPCLSLTPAYTDCWSSSSSSRVLRLPLEVVRALGSRRGRLDAVWLIDEGERERTPGGAGGGLMRCGGSGGVCWVCGLGYMAGTKSNLTRYFWSELTGSVATSNCDMVSISLERKHFS